MARITPEIEAMAGAAGSELSRGGMQTKIEAGKIATQAGTHMVIASGRIEHPLQAIADGAPLHLVPDAGEPGHSAQEMDRRLARAQGHADHRQGRRGGAQKGNSLLPVGVIRVEGTFARGDAVVIRGPDGAEVARGLVAYDVEDAERIKGRASADVLSVLGFGGRAEMVHRDHLVLGRE